LDETAANPDSVKFTRSRRHRPAARLLALCPEPGSGTRTSKSPTSVTLVASQLIAGLRDLRHPTCLSPGEYRQTEMLRITLQEDGTLSRLQLAGRLAGAWVAETENTWRSALISGRPVEIDIREVTGIDEAGRCLLRAMNREGARLIAKGVAMEALVEEITGTPVRGRRA
jgi:hypothetical protein